MTKKIFIKEYKKLVHKYKLNFRKSNIKENNKTFKVEQALKFKNLELKYWVREGMIEQFLIR
jgi:hypothetical protein